jgi:cell wall-associated NlpC family hydrolase
MGSPVRRIAAVAFCFAVLAAPASATGPTRSWAAPQIKLVTARGVFAATPETFRPDDQLTAGALARLVAGVTGKPETAPPDTGAPVSIAQLDSALVGAAGLGDTAYRFYREASRVGLKPPARFGTEAVARLIGLRTNHPAAQDRLELQPQESATRAEAAFSGARLLEFDGWEVDSARAAADTFALPDLTPWQRRILRTAVSFIGYPYVWGGEDERTEHGFDCSGFVWRVYKLAPYAGAPGLSAALRGRTTYELSGEVPKARRIPLDELQPGDVLFFGHGPRSKPKDVDHAGIYLGGGWFIHSSDYGVAVAPLAGWYRAGLAWARRPLAEAGLE